MPTRADLAHLRLHVRAAVRDQAGDPAIARAGADMESVIAAARIDAQQLGPWMAGLARAGRVDYVDFLRRYQTRALLRPPASVAFDTGRALENQP